MEKHRKLKTILSISLAILLVVYLGCLAIYLLTQKGSGLRDAIWFEKGMGYILLQGLGFQTASIGVETALATGFYGYFSIVAFALGLIMMISKKCARYLSNPFVALIGFLSGAYFLGGFMYALRNPEGPTATFLTLEIIGFVISTIFGIVGFVFSMIFPLQIHNEALPEAAPDRIAKEEVIAKPSAPEEEKKEAVESKKEEIPAEASPLADEAIKPVIAEEAEATPEEEAAPENDEGIDGQSEEDVPETSGKVTGKYEIFREAGFFKYRLKANNGEILIVSIGYKSKASVLSGIETLKRNMPNATTRVVTDKNGYAQFRISNNNDSRLIAAGEIYQNEKGASSALASVMKFYSSDKIVDIGELPENETHEWIAELPPIVKTPSGRITLFQEDGKYLAKLAANNGEVLFVTSTYSSRKALLSAIDNLKQKIADTRITIARDKQNRYQFRVFSDNGMLLVVGETYNSKERAIASAASMRNFLQRARIVE